jgi:hypothetical protein
MPMSWCDEKLGLDPAAEMTREMRDAANRTIAGLPVADLVRAWRETKTVSYPHWTAGECRFHMYFDRVGYDDPQRALAFVVADVAIEPDDAIVAMLAEGKLLMQLLGNNVHQTVDGLEAAAANSPRLRWLLGGIAWCFRGGMVEDKAIARRLLAIADEAAFKAWKREYKKDAWDIDFAALPVAELAKAWVEMNFRSPVERERDDNASKLFDYQGDLVKEEPERALALILEILRIEQNPRLLGLLAAGLLEDLLVCQGAVVIDAVEREARGNLAFRQLLTGVYYSSVDDDVAERINRATAQLTH